MNKEYLMALEEERIQLLEFIFQMEKEFSINNVSDDINSYLKRESLVIHAVKPLKFKFKR